MRATPCGVIAGVLVAAALVAPAPTRAQPTAPDFARAGELYRAAEAAMTAGRPDDAARDFGAAYEITRDPILFYKLGTAHEKAGACDVAVTYYQRYLREGNPAEKFVEQTRERIRACGGSLPDAAGSGSGSGSAETGSGSAAPASDPATGSAAVVTATPTAPTDGNAAGSAAPLRGHGPRSAWLLVGGSIGFITIGAVLAYSAGSSESDIADLYVGLGGRTPTFNAATKARYDELVATGERYQYLSWAAFGLAGAAAIGAAVLFATHDGESVQVAPVVTPQGAGASASWRF